MDRGAWRAIVHGVTKIVTHDLTTQFSSVAQFCLSLRPHRLQASLSIKLLEPIQTHIHCIGDAIQPSHLLSSPSPPAFSLSLHQGLSNESVLCIRWPKYWSFSFSISPSNEYLGLISFTIECLISFQSKELSRVFSNTTVQKHPFFSTQLSL